MGPFRQALAAFKPDQRGRGWVFAAPDQLTSAVGPLSAVPARERRVELEPLFASGALARAC